MNVVEQDARAQVVTDADVLRDMDRGTVPVALSYDPGRDPRTVRMRAAGSPAREWTLPRDLLEHGLRTPVERGDVRVWPCGRVQTVVEFHSPRGVSMVQFETKALTRFLRRTHVAAAAAEPVPH
ncbi:SsgA family sporulation/cell division regulator [Streptomyces prasinopilosus]|uniref:Streptomyces sporulation and cell division protein, SsgA n=1 Tax=Streptomyces prasinopilosus TaxID=67344 RepID=A0A1G6R2H9_9ACTN|nr:SsgA family sporulation/cell division regulator [Streptomyces prasinopilosus]SDC98613.1 Streptomyces sporulation and cell division protein, SsgA [Streptomyces prasinopilosus]